MVFFIFLLGKSSMFHLAHAFNQDLKSWDVSNGLYFVSNGKSMGIDLI
jgi:hypothetical protein